MAKIDYYSKKELEAIVNDSHSLKEVLQKIGYSTIGGNNFVTLKKRLQKLEIDYSHFNPFQKTPEKRTVENIFITNSTATQAVLRRWYLKGNYTEYKCSICGMPPEWHGQSLTLILDHINGTNNDNRVENLRWVCPNCNQQLETTGYKKMRVKTRKEHKCLDCGTIISKSATRCLSCENKNRSKIEEKITREELKQLIRSTPFTKIGLKYGVSDNAIRKWCDKFNLPRKSSEIKQYSDEEWEQI